MKKRFLPGSGFTLIEILVVISIIAILMGLLFPAINGVINQARKASAKNDVTQIATAVMGYQAEYGKLPTAGGTVDSTLIGMLTTNNPRKIVFLDVPAYKKGKSGTNASGNYLDPWSNVYNIAVDSDYDNVVTAMGATVNRSVAVWGSTNAYITSSNNIPKSWE